MLGCRLCRRECHLRKCTPLAACRRDGRQLYHPVLHYVAHDGHYRAYRAPGACCALGARLSLLGMLSAAWRTEQLLARGGRQLWPLQLEQRCGTAAQHAGSGSSAAVATPAPPGRRCCSSHRAACMLWAACVAQTLPVGWPQELLSLCWVACPAPSVHQGYSTLSSTGSASRVLVAALSWTGQQCHWRQQQPHTAKTAVD